METAQDNKNIEAFENELKALLQKHNLKISVVVDFPQYRILPKEVELALEVIKSHGGQYLTSYTLVEGGTDE